MGIRRKNLDQPDETRTFDRGTSDLIRLGSHLVGRSTSQPGWRWSTSIGPLMGTPSCPVHHVGLLLSGRYAVRMDDGEEAEFGPNDVMDIPPGHDAWVVGDEPAISIDFGGNVDDMGIPQGNRRVVTTLLMTDLVDSTRTAARIGDAAWRQLLADHDRLTRSLLDRFQGTEITTTGDGFLASFASAAGALRCALSIRDAVPELGLEARIGVHTGEIELVGSDVRGIAVHATARIMGLGEASEILVSAVTEGLAEGNDFTFEDRGSHTVKGLDRPVAVYRLVS
jgi:class 3 adenylate cyclase